MKKSIGNSIKKAAIAASLAAASVVAIGLCGTAGANEAGSAAECSSIPYNSGKIWSCSGDFAAASGATLYVTKAAGDSAVLCGVFTSAQQVCGSYVIISGDQPQWVSVPTNPYVHWFPEIHYVAGPDVTNLLGFSITAADG